MQKFVITSLKVARPLHIYSRLSYFSIIDCITVFNLCLDQFDFVLMSKLYYKSVVDFNLLDFCCFQIVVGKSKFNPTSPVPCNYVGS